MGRGLVGGTVAATGLALETRGAGSHPEARWESEGRVGCPLLLSLNCTCTSFTEVRSVISCVPVLGKLFSWRADCWPFVSTGGAGGRSCFPGCLSLSRVQLFATLWARRAPLSMGVSRQEYWSGLPFPSPGDLPEPGMEPGSPALQASSLPSHLEGFGGTSAARGEGGRDKSETGLAKGRGPDTVGG